jgi:hypothetical protein
LRLAFAVLKSLPDVSVDVLGCQIDGAMVPEVRFTCGFGWWIPYLSRAEPERAARYQIMFGNTHRFLPTRNGLVPNTAHTCFNWQPLQRSAHSSRSETSVTPVAINGWSRNAESDGLNPD